MSDDNITRDDRAASRILQEQNSAFLGSASPDRWPAGLMTHDTDYDQDGSGGPIPLGGVLELKGWLNRSFDQAVLLTSLVAASYRGDATSIYNRCGVKPLWSLIHDGYLWLRHFTGRTRAIPAEPQSYADAEREMTVLLELVESLCDAAADPEPLNGQQEQQAQLDAPPAPSLNGDGQPPKPNWDADRNELWFRGECVREVRAIAKQCRLILASFEELEWPARIDNPLRRNANLSETVRTLNKGLTRIRFRRDGSGGGVLWEPT